MKTARAVVIDEDPKEATALLQALGKIGWSTVYVAGDDEALLPQEPLTGIRLVFLDLKLIPLPEPKQYLPYTVRVLKQTVRMTPGVTGILCWTKHDEEEISLLRAELAAHAIVPAFVEAIPDKLTITQSGSKGIQKLLEIIEAKAAQLPGRALITRWEQVLHDASTLATDDLYELCKDDSTLLKLLASVASAAAEERISSAITALDGLFSGLAAVQIDALEDISNHPPQTHPYGDALRAAIQQNRTEPINSDLRARLNAILLTVDRCAGNSPKPGNIYSPALWQAPPFPVNSTESQVRGFIREVFNKRSGVAEDDAFVSALVPDSIACMVEMTPVCDHANGKCPDARLLGGLLVKSPGHSNGEVERSLPAAARLFAKESEFFWIENPTAGLTGSYRLILNARRLLTLPGSELAKHAPVVRLRYPILSDFSAWFGAHASRPGYVSVR